MTDTTTMTGRQETINRAIVLLDTTGTDCLTAILAKTSLHANWQANPAALRDRLVTAGGLHLSFTAWKAAQQILAAAGLPA
jgi:hypothetical protein